MNEIHLGSGVLSPQASATTIAVAAGRSAVPTRRRLLAYASVLSPLALAAQYALDPTGMLPRDDPAGLLAAIAEQPGQYLASTVVYLVGMVTLLAWALTLFAVLRDRTPRLAATASTLLGIAAIGGAGFAGLRLAACSFVEDGAVTEGAVEIWARIQEGPAFLVLTPLMVAAIVGTVVAGIAMILARDVLTVWAGPLYLAGFVLGSGEFPPAVSVLGGVLQAVAVLPVVRRALGG